LIERGKLRTTVGEAMPLAKARLAHEMLAGTPHRRGKLLLTIGATSANVHHSITHEGVML